ncbi:hypothetical protein KKHLCK_13970 [Candidatus Electrothrix laxa]
MLYKINAFRSVGVIGDGSLTIPMTVVGSVAFLLIMLRYLSIILIPSNQDSIKEMPMEKTLTRCTRVFFCSVVGSLEAIGVGVVAGHLST